MALKLQPFALVDGAVVNPVQSRREMVEKMARDLIRYGAAGNEADAIRSLMGTHRYSPYDIMVLVDDARQVAQQEIVAREMGKP